MRLYECFQDEKALYLTLEYGVGGTPPAARARAAGARVLRARPRRRRAAPRRRARRARGRRGRGGLPEPAARFYACELLLRCGTRTCTACCTATAALERARRRARPRGRHRRDAAAARRGGAAADGGAGGAAGAADADGGSSGAARGVSARSGRGARAAQGESYGTLVDRFAYGVLIHKLVSGEPPPWHVPARAAPANLHAFGGARGGADDGRLVDDARSDDDEPAPGGAPRPAAAARPTRAAAATLADDATDAPWRDGVPGLRLTVMPAAGQTAAGPGEAGQHDSRGARVRAAAAASLARMQASAATVPADAPASRRSRPTRARSSLLLRLDPRERLGAVAVPAGAPRGAVLGTDARAIARTAGSRRRPARAAAKGTQLPWSRSARASSPR